jgi:cell pole-organizing protein PopZ
MPDNAKSSPEPSMEEIIASISRIITEDKRPSEPTRPVAAEKSDILELTEVVNDDGSVSREIPAAGNPNATSVRTATAMDEPTGPGNPAEAVLPRTGAGVQTRADIGRERILSSVTSGAAAAAFAQLGALPRERRKEGELPLGGADRTLEDIVRDMLRPLLQTWLDENLPGMVERLVREEIARVVGDAGLR